MSDLNISLQVFGYALAGLAFFVLAASLLTIFRGRQKGLSVVSGLSVIWAYFMLIGVSSPGLSASQIFWIEMSHDAAWMIFLSVLMSGAHSGWRQWLIRYGGISLIIVIVTTGLLFETLSNTGFWTIGRGDLTIFSNLSTSFYVLVVVEQIYRNARQSQSAGLKFLCIGIGGIFAYDFFLYSTAILSEDIDALIWNARGYVVAMLVPLIGVAAKRLPPSSVGMFVSRQFVFYTATIVVVGIYGTITVLSGYYVRSIGPDWGPAAQLLIFIAGAIGLLVILVSDRTRSRLRVFISKHFFENRYDYREEWLRLIRTLTSLDESMPLKKRTIKALAQILKSPSGLLWLRMSDGEYVCSAGWNAADSNYVLSAGDSVVSFLSSTGWVIEISEFETNPVRYQGLEVDGLSFGLQDAAFIVPLAHDAELIGFVVLSVPSSPVALNFEDRDLLKTAGKQIASYLVQEISTEQLAEIRQFEAFNRLTAYLMHDLKNVIAQQSLVIENAEKHKSNPAFINDAVETIRGSVSRMRQIIEHLKQGSLDLRIDRVEVGKIVMMAVSQCADRRPVPRAKVGTKMIWVCANRDRLLGILSHAIRNAQDATDVDGSVEISVDSDGEECDISIVDSGSGMDADFIRDRLFKPFDSTKGTQGMGIGAYQIKETLKAFGGRVLVESELGRGTNVVLKLKETR